MFRPKPTFKMQTPLAIGSSRQEQDKFEAVGYYFCTDEEYERAYRNGLADQMADNVMKAFHTKLTHPIASESTSSAAPTKEVENDKAYWQGLADQMADNVMQSVFNESTNAVASTPSSSSAIGNDSNKSEPAIVSFESETKRQTHSMFQKQSFFKDKIEEVKKDQQPTDESEVKLGMKNGSR